MKLSSVMVKEGKLLLSDKGFLLIAILQPIIFIVMFGSSFEAGDINHLDTIIVDDDNSVFSSYVISSTEKSEFFDIVDGEYSLDEALKLLDLSKVRCVIYIPDRFEENINSKVTGEIRVYIDSSNFLTYSSLSGAQVEIVKDTLQNVTKDILGDLEEEKNKSKKIIDEVRDILDDVEKESNSLESDVDYLKDVYGDSNFSELEGFVNKVNDSLSYQSESLENVSLGLEDLISSLNDLVVSGASEEAKKQAIIYALSEMKNGFNESIENLSVLSKEVDLVDVPNIDDKRIDVIDNRMEKIKEMFQMAENKSNEVNFNFEKLEKNFLSEPLKINDVAYHGDIKYFDYLGAGVLSLIVFFVCLMAPALNIISEKEKNTLYRLSTMPVSSFKIFLGKFLVFLIFGFFEMIYTLLLAIFLYDLRITGSVFDVVVILTLLACASIAIGLFISSKVKTMQQALVIVPVIVIPSFMISHSFFPPDIMSPFMNYVAYITPMTFSNHALNAVMIKGFGLLDVWFDLFVLFLYTIVPLILFVISFKRIRY